MQATAAVGPGSSVDRLANTPLVEVAAGCSIGDAAQAMRAANVSSALVSGAPSPDAATVPATGRAKRRELKPGLSLAGLAIVTERDMARALAAGLGPHDSVLLVAVRHPVGVSPTTSVLEAAARMLRDEIRHLLVVDEGRVIGIISIRDVMAVLLHSLSADVWVKTLRQAVHSEIWLG